MKQHGFKLLVLVLIAAGAYHFLNRKPVQDDIHEMTQASTQKPAAPVAKAAPVSAEKIAPQLEPVQAAAQTEPQSEQLTTPRRSPATIALEKKITATLQKWNPKSEFSIDNKEDSNTVLIRGGDFQVSKAETETFALQLAAQIGVMQNSLERQSQAVEETSRTEFSEVIEYQQRYKGYLVEDSSLRVFRRNSDQRVYHVASNIKPITQLDDNIQVSNDQAEQSLLNDFHLDRKATTVKKEEHPVVYFDKSAPVLCWKFNVSLTAPMEERQIYVSAITGKIVGAYYSLEH